MVLALLVSRLTAAVWALGAAAFADAGSGPSSRRARPDQ